MAVSLRIIKLTREIDEGMKYIGEKAVFNPASLNFRNQFAQRPYL